MMYVIAQGGPVMWLILLCSFLALTIFLERLFHLHRAQIKTADFLKGLFNVLRRGNVVEAVSICEETPGPVASLVRAGILQHDEERVQVDHAIKEAGLAEIPRLERHLGLLATTAHVAPLLGLLGTVLGLMHLLSQLQQNAPLVQVGDVAGGVWQALITTAGGLAVAIPAYAAYNFLIGRIEVIVLDMEHAAMEVGAFLKDQKEKK